MKSILFNKLFLKFNSLFLNLFFWVRNFYLLQETLQFKKEIENNVNTLEDIKEYISMFVWFKDGWIDWRPWVVTFIAKNFKDDCDGAAYFAKWLFKCIGIDTNLYLLIGKKENHLVCVAKSLKIVVSNNEFIDLNLYSFEKDGVYYIDSIEKQLLYIFPSYKDVIIFD